MRKEILLLHHGAAFFTVHQSEDFLKLASSSHIQRINNRYSLFAYVVEGFDVLQSVGPGDIIVDTEVINSPWELIT